VGQRARITRARFFRRFALIGAGMAVCAMIGLSTLVWLAATSLGLVSSDSGVPPMIVGGVLASAAVLVAIVTMTGALRRAGGPLAKIMEAADRVADGDYDVRVAEQGPPPIRALARAFNTMTGRLQNNDRQRRDLMADIAHELRTPLTVIQGKLEGLLDGVYPRDDGQLQQLLEQAHVLSRLVEDLRTLALSESGALKLQREPTDLAALARDVVRAMGADALDRHVAVDAADDLASIHVDPVRIREVLGNLLSNALRHTPAGGSVLVQIAAAPDGALAVEVRDTGAGMAPEQLAHAFDRFFKSSTSRGSGLGLTIAKSLVVAHGGTIRASSEPGRGTTITFELPAT
jgi:two-component system OmpR family sensor kinase/two-component system sensor histidine kinase BaeS